MRYDSFPLYDRGKRGPIGGDRVYFVATLAKPLQLASEETQRFRDRNLDQESLFHSVDPLSPACDKRVNNWAP